MKLIQRLVDKIHELKAKHDNKKDFSESLILAVRDGILTEEEVDTLERKKTAYGLSDTDLHRLRITAYNVAFAAAKADGKITEAESAELAKIQNYLGIRDHEVQQTKADLYRLRLIDEIQQGNLPVQSVTNIILQRGETVHWVEPAKLLEERVVSRRYSGGSSGFSFRICKGVSYRVGASRGRVITDTAIVPISSGELALSNKRVIFAGDTKSFTVKLDKLLNIEFYDDGLQLHGTTGKPKTIQLGQPAHIDIVGAVLSSTINSYSS